MDEQPSRERERADRVLPAARARWRRELRRTSWRSALLVAGIAATLAALILLVARS